MLDDPANKVEDFFKTYASRTFPKGQILVLSGDIPKHIHFLIKGTVKEYDVTTHGDEIILNIFKPGAFFPMSFALNEAPSPFIFEADSIIEIRTAPMNEVLTFVQNNPDVLLDLLTRVYRGTDSLLGRMAQLMSGSAKSRLAYELKVHAQRFGAKTRNNEYRITITEKELGARAGLSRETVSRELNKLKKAGLVTLSEKQIIIHDIHQLTD